MDVSKIAIGKNVPDEVNVIIEIPANSGPIKYEFDKDSGAVFVDRIMPTSFSYPCNYGFIPHTLSGDGDPVDVLVYSSVDLQPGVVINVRPIGYLMTEDESGQDEKVLAVPAKKVDQFLANINSYEDLPEIMLRKIEHFFNNYKALEKGKWVKLDGWRSAEEAKKVILSAIERAKGN